MTIKVQFEISDWQQKVGIGLVVGLLFGIGITRAIAEPVVLSHQWKDGDVLTADKLNQNFLDLKDAMLRLQDPDCPPAYARDTSQTPFIVCKMGKDEVVKVGTGNAAFWIDRYEASIWEAMDASTRLEVLPATFPQNGQYTKPLYALSVAGFPPKSSISWFQADAACEASGKRLPTGYEWLRAARGTEDPGSDDGATGKCVTNTKGPRDTGLGTNCQSRWGAQDLIGNLWEWTAEWYTGVRSQDYGARSEWLPKEDYSDSTTCNLSGVVVDQNDNLVTLPAAALHGGHFQEEQKAGIYALSLNASPSFAGAFYGFRCMIPR